MNYLKLDFSTDNGLMNLPSFVHIAYFNLKFDGVPSKRHVEQLRFIFNAYPQVYIRYYKRFKKARRKDYQLGFTINKTLLDALIEEIEGYFIDREIKKSIKKLRQEISNRRKSIYNYLVEKDGEYCQYCNSVENLEIDHIIPVSKGGTNDRKNLQLLCRTCNGIKSNN